MSACSSTLRAISCSPSRTLSSKTLLPFLYHTATIQRWKPAARSIAQRNFISRSNGRDDVPFEDDTLPPPVQQEPTRQTTITGSERAAFEKLYKKFNTRGKKQREEDGLFELDQIADEYYEDEEHDAPQSLDRVFDEALQGSQRLRETRDNRSQSKTEQKDPSIPSQGSPLSFKQLKLAERARVDQLLQSTKTDRELWQILEQEVFDKIRRLDLDGTRKGKAHQPTPGKGKVTADATAPDPRIIFQNYPNHLVTAVRTLRLYFPSSPLPLTILPTMRSLGRSSYALGATSTLYAHLIRVAWIQHSSYTHVDALLAEMNNGAIEFDASILTLLDAMIREHELAQSSHLGRAMQMVYGMEQFLGGIGKIKQWRNIVAERLGVISEERRMLLKRANQGKGVHAHQPHTPRDTETRGDKSFRQTVGASTRQTAEDLSLMEGLEEMQGDLQNPVGEDASTIMELEAALPPEDIEQEGQRQSSSANTLFIHNGEVSTEEEFDERTEPTKAIL